MALGFNEGTSTGGSSDFAPIIKYDANAGRFFRVDREQGPEGWSSKSIDITKDFQAIFDLENIEVGWLDFTNGRPDIRTAPIGQPRPDKPTDAHKPGFKLRVKLGTSIANGAPIRELTANSKTVRQAMDAVHDVFLSKRDGDKVPLVKLDDVTPVEFDTPKGKKTAYAPIFSIVKWVDRPTDLPAPGAAPAPKAAAPSTGSKVATPPAVPEKLVFAGGTITEDDFG